jgi:digeranylgeranylglycerophospholipid reductase
VTERVDVAVVGGGPAGTTAARVVAAAGLRVTVFEREPELGSPVHTSGALAVEVMRRFAVPAELYHPLPRLRLCSPNETAAFDFPEPVGCVIDVRGVYQHLGREAERAGARIETGAAVLQPLVTGGAVTGCRVRNGGVERDVAATIVVDASGYRAEPSRAAGLHPGFGRFGVGAEHELIAPRCRQDEALLLVGNRYAPAGYAWVLPWGNGRVRVGVGVLHSDTRADARKLLAALMADLASFGVDLAGHEVVETHFGLIPATGLARRLAGDGIVAAGDAGGVASLIVGEGIRLSMISGEMAGRAVVDALRRGRADAASLRPYDRAFRAQFARDLRIGASINRRIARWSDDRWDAAVRSVRDVPPAALAALLQSEFSLKDVAAWLVARPGNWPRLARWTLAAAYDYARELVGARA